MLAFFLPAIIALGIITGYEDIRYGKIKNKWVVLTISYAVIAYTALIVFYALTTGIDSRYLLELATNILISIIAGFSLYYYKIWSAGDGKLFIAFAALIPLTEYSLGYQKYFPAITLLINTFIPALIILLTMIALRLRKKNLKTIMNAAKEIMKPKKIAESALYLFSILWILQIPFTLMGFDNYILKFAIMIAVFPIVKKKADGMMNYFLIGISIARLFADKTVYSIGFMYGFTITVFFWIILYGFFNGAMDKLSNELFTKEIRKRKFKETIPFAPFIFIGVILTLIAKGNILIYLRNILS